MLANRHGKNWYFFVAATTGNQGQSNMLLQNLVDCIKSIALEVARRNINVNIVSPGFILLQ